MFQQSDKDDIGVVMSAFTNDKYDNIGRVRNFFLKKVKKVPSLEKFRVHIAGILGSSSSQFIACANVIIQLNLADSTTRSIITKMMR